MNTIDERHISAEDDLHSSFSFGLHSNSASRSHFHYILIYNTENAPNNLSQVAVADTRTGAYRATHLLAHSSCSPIRIRALASVPAIRIPQLRLCRQGFLTRRRSVKDLDFKRTSLRTSHTLYQPAAKRKSSP
jgi:hypothetical protein